MANIKRTNSMYGAADSASNKSLSNFHISDKNNMQYFEVARNNLFVLQITDVSDLLSADGKTKINGDVWEEGLRISLTKCNPPHFSINPIKIQRGNSSVKAADVPEWSDCQIEFEDYIGLNTKGLLEAWHNLAYVSTEDTIGRMSEYKKNAVLIEYDSKHTLVRSWDLIGCWVSTVQESPFDVTSTGERVISATLVYDRAIEHDF